MNRSKTHRSGDALLRINPLIPYVYFINFTNMLK